MASRKLITLLLLSVTVAVQSCKPPQPGVYKDDKIPSGVKSKLNKLNTDLLNALKSNNPEDLELLMTQNYIDKGHERLVTTEHISNEMKTADYSAMAEYYIVNNPRAILKTDTVHQHDQGVNKYDLVFNGSPAEEYITFFTAKTAAQKSLITATYQKLDYGWKVSNLEINPYAENGRTAPELIQQAKEQLKNGYWLDASNTASFAINCISPCNSWKYTDEDSIYKFNKYAFNKLTDHYVLPIIVSAVPTKPHIWRVTIERNKYGAFPNINYVSTINLFDTVALKKENIAVGKLISGIFKGIDKDKKFIFYTVYNRNKNGGIPVQTHYDFVQKL